MPAALPRPKLPQALQRALLSLRELLFTTSPFVLLAIGLLALAYHWLEPTPPRRVVLATGVAQGAYAGFGERYAALLARHGITVALRPTQGSAENLALLTQEDGGVDLAFVQGGTRQPPTGEDAPATELVSLGSMFHEPVWLFYREASARRLTRGAPVLTRLSQLAGGSLNIGAPGSGVPPLLQALLAANRIEPGTIRLQQQATTPAVVDLLEGRLDALALASAPESQMVQMLLQTPGIRLFDFAQAEAYARRFAYMSPVKLPRGVVDLARDLPPADVQLIAPTATLVAREDLHPALVQLFVQAAQQVHGGAGWFQHKGEFPNAGSSEWPIAAEAQRVYTSGVPWLQRYLPFWVANLADRMWLALLGIVAVLIPLARVLPPVYEFRIRSRVFRWYAQLRSVDEARGLRPQAELLAELDTIERHVGQIVVPLSYADELYALRSHLDLVRRRLLDGTPPAADPAASPA
jgi:TRAP-type uncharacterized transport system substrate-binding protein